MADTLPVELVLIKPIQAYWDIPNLSEQFISFNLKVKITIVKIIQNQFKNIPNVDLNPISHGV